MRLPAHSPRWPAPRERPGDQLDEVAEFLAEFANKFTVLGPAGYLRSTSHCPGEAAEADESREYTIDGLPEPEEA